MRSLHVLRAFVQLELTSVKDFAAQHANKVQIVVFKSLVVGIGAMSSRYFHADLRLPIAVPNALQLYRDRLYRTLNVDPPTPLTPVIPGTPIKAIAVHNKRWKEGDRALFASLANVTYIDFGNKDKGQSLQSHLLLLRDTQVYITGPGTSLIYHPLLPDGSVVINVGALVGQDNDHKCTTKKNMPFFKEIAYAPTAYTYQHVLYHNSALRQSGLDLDEIQRLLSDAWTKVGSTPLSFVDNLSAEGQLFVRACTQPSNPCREFLAVINSDYAYSVSPQHSRTMDRYTCSRTWMEFAVYEVCGYAETGYVGPSGSVVCGATLPRELFRALRHDTSFAGRLAVDSQPEPRA